MSQTVITSAFEQLKAQQAANGGVVILDEFVFANVPNLNITDPIDRAEQLPDASMIVHRQDVGKTGMVNNNAVVYSVVMGADVGDFAFNWVGLVSKATGVVAMIVHAPEQKKLKTTAGQQGNVLTRSFLMEYNGASEQTQIITPADTWQIDFTARLNAVDERVRLENRDIYGAATFFADGFKLSKSGVQYSVASGVGYVAGLRAELLFAQTLKISQLPAKVWVDVSWKGTLTSVWDAAVKITVADRLSDYVESDEKHFVYALADIDINGVITDLRTQNQGDGFNLVSELNKKQPLDGGLTGLSGLDTSVDKVAYFTGRDKAALTSLTATGREIVGSKSPDEALSRLGLASASKASGATKIALFPAGNVQHLVTFLSFDMFDIVKDESVDVTAEIKAVFEKASELGLPVIQNSGRYLISGNDVITSTVAYDLDGATLVPAAGYTGYFLGTQKEQMTTHEAGSAVVSAINSAPLLAGDSVLKGMKNSEALNGCAIFMQGVDPLFVGRGKTKYWYHGTRVTSRGKMDDRMKYGVSAVSQVRVLPVKKKMTVFRLPAWDFKNGPANNGVMRFNNLTRARIYAGAVYNRPLQDNGKNPVIVSVNYVWDVRVEDFYDDYPALPVVNGELAYAYTLNFNYVTRMAFKNCCSQGYGWGVVAGQCATNLTYENCNLNRIDMHEPFMGYLRAVDCTTGTWGVSVFGLGDMYLDRLTIDTEDSHYGGYREIRGLINNRPDMGGVFDGAVYINDLTITGDAAAYRDANDEGVPLFSAYSYNASEGFIPEGSPVQPWGFREIVVKGLRCTDRIAGRRFGSIVSAGSVQQATWFPLRIKIEDADFNSTEPECIDLHGFRIPAYNSVPVGIANTLNFKPTNFIEINDSSLAGMEIIRPYSSYDYHNIDFKMNNVRNTGDANSPVSFHTDQCGRYEFNHCAIRKISDKTYSGGSLLNRYSTFVINGGVVNSLTELPFDLTFNSGYNTPVLATNVMFVGKYSQSNVTAANTNVAEFARCENCKFFSNDTVSYVNPALWLGAAGAGGQATSFNVARENNLTLAMTLTSGSNSVNAAKSVRVPAAVAGGNEGGSVYADTLAASANYQLYINARGLKANIWKVMSSASLTGIYLE
ncbi:TPA: phage tail protein [Klebsiella quasipneumoniae]